MNFVFYVLPCIRKDGLNSSRHIYAPVNYAITGSENGLSPIQRQAIVWVNVAFL